MVINGPKGKKSLIATERLIVRKIALSIDVQHNHAIQPSQCAHNLTKITTKAFQSARQHNLMPLNIETIEVGVRSDLGCEMEKLKKSRKIL